VNIKSFLFGDIYIFVLDPRLMFNFIDANGDSRISYLEFRSWMLIMDRTLAEHELLQIFNEMDRNGLFYSFIL
jgi:Ca2+-binding EF-hand superfamily protein